MEPHFGQIQIFGFNFPPLGWEHCNGQIISISQNTALFTLIGTIYGGNGQSTFALPDLRGRTPIHPGRGAGLIDIAWGRAAGVENVTLLANNLPAHAHPLNVSNVNGSTNEPAGKYFAKGAVSGSGPNASVLKSFTNTAPIGSDAAALGSLSVGLSQNSNQPVEIRNPYLGVYYSISMQGIFPSRA